MLKVTIKSGDTLSKLAHRYLGNPNRWMEIWERNKSTLRSGNPNLIYPGEVVIIIQQDNTEKKSQSFESEIPGDIYPRVKAKNSKLTAEINGKIYHQWQSISLSTSLESLQWTATLNGVFDRSDPGITPFGNERLRIFVDDVLLYTGYIDSVSESSDSNGIAMRASSSSYAILADDQIDSGEVYENETAFNLIKNLTSPQGIKVVNQTVKGEVQIPRFEISPGESRESKILEVADIVGFLVLSSPNGNLILNNPSKPLTILEINDKTIGAPVVSLDTDIRALKSSVVCRRTSEEGTIEKSVVKSDEERNVTMVVEANDIYNLKLHAEKIMKKKKAESIKISISLSSIIDAEGQVYRVGSGVKVNSHLWESDEPLIISAANYTQSKTGVGCNLEIKFLEAFK